MRICGDLWGFIECVLCVPVGVFCFEGYHESGEVLSCLVSRLRDSGEGLGIIQCHQEMCPFVPLISLKECFHWGTL